MKNRDVILQLQELLQVPEGNRFPRIGPVTRARIELLSRGDLDAEYSPDPKIANDLGHAGLSNAHDINQKATQLIQHFESCELKAYADEVGVWTIGWGHTGLQHKDGTVFPGRVITQEKADQLFHYDMEQFEARVSALVKVRLTEDQYGALVAFDFNTGGLGKSSLLVALNQENYEGAANGLLLWNRAGGKVLNGLVRRRHSERRLFLGMDHFILKDMHEVELEKQGKL